MTSAARAIGRAAICARILRAASDAAAVREARDQLAGALREEALRVLVGQGVPAQARDDLAQGVTVNVLGRILEGAVAPGFEDGYLAVAAKNRARDWHREESGVYEKRGKYEEGDVAAPGLDPCAALEHAEYERRMSALVERVGRILDGAPPRYRDVLIAVYLDGTPIDALVEQEMYRSFPCLAVGDGIEDAIAVRRRARARVDKLLQRARDWVRARVAGPPKADGAKVEAGPPTAKKVPGPGVSEPPDYEDRC